MKRMDVFHSALAYYLYDKDARVSQIKNPGNTDQFSGGGTCLLPRKQ